MSHYTQQETKRHEGRSHSRGRSSRHSSGSSRSLFSGCFSADDSDGSSGSGNLKVSLGIFSWMLLGLGLTRPRPKEYRRMQKYGADAKPKKHHSHRRGGKERLARNEAPRNGRVYEYERREGSRQAHRERRQVIDKSIAPHGPRPVPQYQPSQRSRNERQVSPEQIDEDMLADLLRPEWKSPTTSPLPPSFTSRSGRSSGDHRGHSRPSERRSHSENLYHLTLTYVELPDRSPNIEKTLSPKRTMTTTRNDQTLTRSRSSAESRERRSPITPRDRAGLAQLAVPPTERVFRDSPPRTDPRPTGRSRSREQRTQGQPSVPPTNRPVHTTAEPAGPRARRAPPAAATPTNSHASTPASRATPGQSPPRRDPSPGRSPPRRRDRSPTRRSYRSPTPFPSRSHSNRLRTPSPRLRSGRHASGNGHGHGHGASRNRNRNRSRNRDDQEGSSSSSSSFNYFSESVGRRRRRDGTGGGVRFRSLSPESPPQAYDGNVVEGVDYWCLSGPEMETELFGGPLPRG